MKIRDVTNQPQSHHDLDKILVLLVELIVKKVEKKGFDTDGLVGAAVVSKDYPVFISFSQQLRDKTVHAERNAINKFKSRHNLTQLPAGTLVVSTLSPCSEHIHNRLNYDCSSFLHRENVKRVYCGCRDETQDDSNDFTYTPNKSLERICKKIASTFIHRLASENDK
jgi:pyrimidine deaminase RibD-like protein